MCLRRCKKLFVCSIVIIFGSLHVQGQSTRGLTRQELNALAIDPQSWKLQEQMTWADWRPNPVINYEDPKDNPIRSKRTIKGMLILADFPDQPMISGMPIGSELMGNPLVNQPDKSRLGQYWVDFLNKPSKENNYVTLNGYFLENSYGDWEIELDACGPYTLSRFEFQYGLGYASNSSVSYQRFSDWFARGSANAEAYNLAKADGVQFFTPNAEGNDRDPVYDFVFVLHAGYDQSGSWQELGEMMFLDENTIHSVPAGQVKHPVTGVALPDVSGYDFSGEARIDRILAIVTAKGFDIKQKWPNFYLFNDTLTQNAEFRKLKEVDPALTKEAFDATYPDRVQEVLLEKLRGAKAEANNRHDNQHYASARTRYVPWSTWYGALGIWSGAGAATDSLAGFSPKRIPLSIQGENDGMGTFAHEFGHLMSLPDNYNNPYDIPRTRSYTGPYELMSRGSFGGPGGNHLRYQIPSTMSSTCPPNQVLRSKMGQGYTTPDEIVDISYASIKNAPLIAEVVARNIPTDKGVPNKSGKPITGNRGIRITDMVDATPKDNNIFGLYTAQVDSLRIEPGKWNWGRNVNYTGYTIEVLEQTGYDSFINDHGVMIAKTANSGATTIFVQDAHPTPLDLIDFTGPNGDIAMISEGDQLQLASALFHAGVHHNPDYFKERYPQKFRSNDMRTGVHGNVVNEYVDPFNELQFYILEKNTHAGKYGDYLSYRIAVRSTAPDAAKVNGTLTLKAGKFEPASQGRYAVQHFTLTQSKNAGNTDIVRIRLFGDLADDATVLNNLYAIDPGGAVKFAVYLMAADGPLDKFPMNKLTVKVFSETNGDKEDTYGKAAVKIHTITFLPNSGAGNMAPEKVYDSENYVLKTNTFTRPTFTLSGWNTTANGSGTAYVPGATLSAVTSDITLYAQWTISRYSITYNANGGTGRISVDADIEHGSAYTVKANTFIREGYAFTGWNTMADGSGITYMADGNFAVTEEVTLYAQWKQQGSDTGITAKETNFLALLDYDNVDRLAQHLTCEIGNRYTSTFRRDMAVDWMMTELISYGYEPLIHEFENNNWTNNGSFEVDGKKYIYYGPAYAAGVYQFTGNMEITGVSVLHWTDVGGLFVVPADAEIAGRAVVVALHAVQGTSPRAIVPNAEYYYHAALALQTAGAKAVVFELPAPRLDENTSYARIGNTAEGTAITIPVGTVLYDEIDAALSSMDGSTEVKLTMAARKEGKNVLAVLPSATGSKKSVYVTAHFDSTISGPGMNDNGSGTVMTMEMARAFREAKFEYNIVFLLCDAEEAGMRGSRSYCMDMTDEERANFVANYNMDMIATAQDDCIHFFLNINDTNNANASRLRAIQNELSNDQRLIEIPEALALAKQYNVFNNSYLAAQKLGFDMNYFNICWDSTTDHWAFVQEATRAGNDFPNMMNAVEFDWRTSKKGVGFETLYHKAGDTYANNFNREKIKRVGDLISLAIYGSAKGFM